MDARLLASRLRRRSGGRVCPRGRRLLRARTSRRLVVHVSVVRSGELPKSLRFGLPYQQRRNSPGQGDWAMMQRIHGSGTEMSTCTARLMVFATLFVSVAAWSAEAPSPEAAAAAAKRDSTRCVAQADLDPFNDAIRPKPRGPEVRAGFADTLVLWKRPAEPLVYYA